MPSLEQLGSRTRRFKEPQASETKADNITASSPSPRSKVDQGSWRSDKHSLPWGHVHCRERSFDDCAGLLVGHNLGSWGDNSGA